MTNSQKTAVLAHVQIAKQGCGNYWRLALAVSAHETNFWQSRLSRNWNNHHGIKACGNQARADAIGHRSYMGESEVASWRSFDYLLRKSTIYREDRLKILDLRHEGKSQHEIEQKWIELLAKNPGQYCPGPEWPVNVREMHDRIWEMLP